VIRACSIFEPLVFFTLTPMSTAWRVASSVANDAPHAAPFAVIDGVQIGLRHAAARAEGSFAAVFV
jgi:hypothetical protein